MSLSLRLEASVTVNPNIKDWDPTTMMETGYLTVKDFNGNDVNAEPSQDEKGNWIFFVNVPDATPMFMVFTGQRNSCKGSCC